jgi:aryl-alcohol dehydrogenase-like predicted oxidoreductase
MEQRPLGRTGLTVSAVGMGTWELGGREWGEIGEREVVGLLQYAFERGITFYDTSDQYGGGRVERLLGQAFSGGSDQVVIATKVGYEIDSDGWISRGAPPPKYNASPDYLRTAVEGSLRRLGREVIDVYQFHAPPPPDQWDAAFETMEQLKARGLIRFYGMCLGSAEQALKAIRETGISTLMLTYNLLDQSMAPEVMPAAHARGIGVLVRQPLASGMLSGQLTPETVFAENDYRKTWPREKFLSDLRRVDAIKARIGETMTLPQAALQFILSDPVIASVVPGMMTPAQIDDGVASSGPDQLPPAVLQQLQGLGASSA